MDANQVNNATIIFFWLGNFQLTVDLVRSLDHQIRAARDKLLKLFFSLIRWIMIHTWIDVM
jgi:hypothetical protein